MTMIADIRELQHGRGAGVGFLRRPGHNKTRPLVLLHGVGSNAQSFALLMTALPPAIDAIAWNAPGYADSAPLDIAAPAPGDYANALARMLDALGLARVVLAGHSLGALFAVSFAANHPDRVAALALLSPALGYEVPTGAPLPPAVQARIDEINDLGPAAFAAKRAPRLVSNPQDKPQILAAVQSAMASMNPAGYAQAVRALGAGNLIADAATISAPTFVVVGSGDVITPPENARKAHAAFRHAVGYREIPGAGHACPQEAPAALADILAQLVEKTADV